MTSPSVAISPPFADAARMTLIRRTYALLTVTILWTIAVVAGAIATPAVLELAVAHPFIILLLSIGALLGTNLVQAQPLKLAWLAFFVTLMGISLAPVMLMYNTRAPGVISQAALLTGSTFTVLTLYALLSRRDFSQLGGFLTVGLWVLLATSLLNMFFHNETASLWLAGVTVFLFSGFIVYDTSKLKGNLGPNDYITATVSLYLDVLNLFMALLRILSVFQGGGRSRS